MQPNVQMIDALLQQRNVKKAEIIIARLLRTQQSDVQQARLLIRRARTRLMNGRPEAAIHDLTRAAALDSDESESPAYRELLADCYFARFELSAVGFIDRNDAHLALQGYRDLIARFPDYPNLGWALYQLGRVYLTDNQAEEAVKCFQQALLSPSTQSALTAYCYERMGFVAFYEQRAPQRALSFLNKAIDTYPIHQHRGWLVQIYLLRARVFCEVQHRDAGLDSAQQALRIARLGGSELRSVLAEALLFTAEILASTPGNEQEIVEHLEQYRLMSRRPVGLDVTWARLHEMLGDAYFELGLYAEAINAYFAVLHFNPHYPWEVSIYYRIGRAYYFSGNYERAIDALRRALSAAEGDDGLMDSHLYDIFGSAHFALGRYEQAAQAYAQALAVKPARLATSHQDKIRRYYEMSLNLAAQ